jgi:hypothetical protein
VLFFSAIIDASSALLSLISSSIEGLASLPAAIAAYSAFFLASGKESPSFSAFLKALVAAFY